MCSASRKCLPLSRCSTSRLRRNRMWCTVHKLATPQELAGLLGPRIRGTTGGPPQSHLRSQRGMPSRYGWKLSWDPDTSYPRRTIPVPRISPSRFRIMPIQAARECIWIGQAIYWLSMARRVALKLASSRKLP